ncbi:hypothetical protein [Leifsonia shinshuensis]|uniref:Uncharacterized protein n=1 Tax=Leifsonia shinshuensis TaxID=150026 RepID=A0A7G6Y5J5_9MICO|nr:hypothetical protein [Leifsonia shinshuensis]QNE33760.1 hypothetical protein F1C12_00440 [Leifsonia shinshuensis]
MLGSLFADTIGWFGGAALANRLTARGHDRRAAEGTFLAGLRVLSGRHQGLSSDWRIADCTVAEGRVRMENLTVRVLGVAADEPRQATLREVLAASPTTIYRLETASAVVEWSLLSRHASRARSLLGE